MKYRVWCLRHNRWHPGEGNVPTYYDSALAFSEQVTDTEVREYPSDTNTPAPAQRWGVWYSTPTESQWCEPLFDNESDAIRFEQRSNAKARRYDPHCKYQVRPYPAPTPPAKVEGEYTAGIRADIDAICNIYRTVGEAMYNEPRERLVMRIDQRFTILAAENARLREALEVAVAGVAACLSYPRGSEAQVRCIEEHGFDMAAIRRQHLNGGAKC
jgi:hypothetical protein